MNNDLISRKELLKNIDEMTEEYSYEKDGVAVMDVLTCVRDMVSDMPTAYDKHKVLEQLKKKYYSCDLTRYEEDGSEYEDGRFDAYNDALEIVKKGGAE